MTTWRYDEFKHCGVDYAQAEQAAVYDERHERFRDYAREFGEMLDFLELRDISDMTMIDLGCGTGATALFAARRFKTVYAVDVSPVMIARAREKMGADVSNLKFVHAGFLTYSHENAPADLAVAKVTLHHLPDFWKQVALLRINRMLKPGAWFYLMDVVFQFEAPDYVREIEGWISHMDQAVGSEFSSEAKTHIRDEYSTFGWIMRGMLERAGFTVEKSRVSNGVITEYACRKTRDVPAEETGVS